MKKLLTILFVFGVLTLEAQDLKTTPAKVAKSYQDIQSDSLFSYYEKKFLLDFRGYTILDMSDFSELSYKLKKSNTKYTIVNYKVNMTGGNEVIQQNIRVKNEDSSNHTTEKYLLCIRTLPSNLDDDNSLVFYTIK